MKALFLTHHYLHKNSGGSFASRAYINAMAECVSELTLLYPENGFSIDSFINSKVNKIGVKNKTSNIGKLFDVYCGRLHRYTKEFWTTLKKTNPDIVVFDNSRTSAGLIKKVRRLGIKVITIHHNYEMQYYLGTPPHWTYRLAFLYFMRRTEKNAVQLSSLNLTLTEDDILLLSKNYDKNRRASYEKSGCFEFKQRNIFSTGENKYINKDMTFAITGNLSARQTEISLIPFLNDYYPVLHKKNPNFKLIVAGKNPGKNIIELCNSLPNTNLIPNPIDMSDVLLKADVYICPVNVGGGLKLRVMDGLKEGVPVLTHKVSGRGYEVFREEECLFEYDSIKSFEEGLDKIINKHKNNLFSKNHVSNIYTKYFSFESGVKRLAEILNRI